LRAKLENRSEAISNAARKSFMHHLRSMSVEAERIGSKARAEMAAASPEHRGVEWFRAGIDGRMAGFLTRINTSRILPGASTIAGLSALAAHFENDDWLPIPVGPA
jgi:hypothetical protein